ncbi:hypothetical protein [Salinibacterium sp. ZJ77]|uniref:hypothetical protein n=1 Tax=Salinibacterium sp. ZJ77 TaxID=2708337 RepID=UPI001423CF21|nr:hypothetical protein [Salinibacterium sp. ZJ77]
MCSPGGGYGDASSDSAEPTTLAEAHEITLGHQLEIAAYFPAELTADTRTTETSPVIYGCGGENDFQ